MFICGSGNFSHQDEDETESYGSPCHTRKRSKRNTSFCKIIGKDNNSDKNPYANRGLDKFYSLLADLDDKKQKIYGRMGAEEISFVQFVYTNESDHIKPIVVKVKEKTQGNSSTDMIKISIKNSSTSNINAADHGVVTGQTRVVTSVSGQRVTEVPKDEINEKPRKKRRCLRCKGSFKLGNLKQPYLYFTVILVMILVFLAMYGRSFAILCTSVGWYMAPTIVRESSSSLLSTRRKPKRKEYVSRPTHKKINVHREGPSSPKSVINGLIQIK